MYIILDICNVNGYIVLSLHVLVCLSVDLYIYRSVYTEYTCNIYLGLFTYLISSQTILHVDGKQHSLLKPAIRRCVVFVQLRPNLHIVIPPIVNSRRGGSSII